MPRLTDLDLDAWDITWFAIDRNDLIATFFSGGEARVAEYYVEDSTRISTIDTYFRAREPITGNEIQLTPKPPSVPWSVPCYWDAKEFAIRGLTVFDHESRWHNGYFRLCSCSRPLLLGGIDQEIADMLRHVRIDCSFADRLTIFDDMVRPDAHESK